MVKNKINKSRFSLILLLVLIFLSLSIFGYYTNINKFFGDSNKADGFTGFALEREADDFIVNGCGADTMLDTLTGLCWDKNMNRGGAMGWASNTAYGQPIWNDITNVYNYPVGRVKSDYPAFESCEDSVIGGKNDWRMPTNNEFRTLLDEIGGVGSTCITLASFGFTNCQDNYYWSSEEWKSNAVGAWTIRTFVGGTDLMFTKSDLYYVACVRR